MKPMQLLAKSLGILALGGASLFAQNTVTIDPVDALVNPISLGEWDTDGELDGWTTQNFDATVAGGFLTGPTITDDGIMVLAPLPVTVTTGTPSLVTIDVRMKRSITDGSDLQIFWADAGGGFSEGRSALLAGDQFPTDGLFHTYRFEITNVNGYLQDLRIDGSREIDSDLSYDFVRLRAQSFGPSIDPPDLLNIYTSLGEWNSDGDEEGWTVNNIDTPTVASGLLTGLTIGNDPQFVLGGQSLDTSTGDLAIVEIRMRKEVDETSRIDLFWGDDAGGISADRMISIPAGTWPNDGNFHVVQFPIGDLFTGNVNIFRFDPNSDLAESRAIDLDYVRIGVSFNDGDSDGLADAVETNTGIFVDANDTGTDPANADSDNDTFLDGVEVAFGTDPNDSTDFPEPSIVSYLRSPASYVVDVQITANALTVANGTPTGFSITPALPAGLTFNTSTGAISGKPTAATAASDYTVTANFSGGISDFVVLNLEVLNPSIVRYGVTSAVYNVGVNVSTNSPLLVGPFPDSFSITPEVPEGLFFDTFDGSISGFATTTSPATDYVVTAEYDDYPDSSVTLSIRIKAQPELIGVDLEPLRNFVPFAEWDFDGDLEGWSFFSSNGTAAGGVLLYDTTAGDPQMNRPGFLDVSAGTILEFRLKQSDTEMIQFFWADDGGGLSEGRSFRFQTEFQFGDDEFHTYQIRFDEVFDGDVTHFRVDPGAGAGRSIEFDYLRFGSGSAPKAPSITAFSYDKAFQEVSLTWTSTQNTSYQIESSPNLLDWTVARSGITGNADTTTFIVDSTTTRNFFRVVRE